MRKQTRSYDKELFTFSNGKMIRLHLSNKKVKDKIINKYYDDEFSYIRPNTHENKRYDKVGVVMWDWLIQEQNIKSPLDIIINKLKTIQTDLIYLNNKFSKKENDSRSGLETYGYESEESIKGTLTYLSDRWSCQFRTRWLLDLIKQKGDIKCQL